MLTLCATLVMFLLLIGCDSAEAKTLTVDDDGGADYTNIQDAIDNATKGDTVRVYDGLYEEDVVVDKTIDLIGNGTETTTIDGSGWGDVVQIAANWVNTSGFSVTGSGAYPDAGIKIVSNFNTVVNNSCSGNAVGIGLDHDSAGNTLARNICSSNAGNGIVLDNADGNTITDNACISNGYDGIYLVTSGDNTITGNICNDGIYGIGLDNGSNGNTLSSNTCSNNIGNGIALEDRCSDNALTLNTCPNNEYAGIFLDSSDGNTISNNVCNENRYGLHLKDSTDCIYDSNELTGNVKDIKIEPEPAGDDDDDDDDDDSPGFGATLLAAGVGICFVFSRRKK